MFTKFVKDSYVLSPITFADASQMTLQNLLSGNVIVHSQYFIHFGVVALRCMDNALRRKPIIIQRLQIMTMHCHG